MPSEIERVIASYRAQVLSRDTAALTRLELAYQESLDRLRPAIELLQQQVNGLDDPKPGDVFRLERYKEIERQAKQELDRLGQLGEMVTTTNQRELVNLAGQSARAMVMAQAPSIAMQWVNVPTQAIQDLVGTLSDGSPLARLFDDIAPDALLKARGILTDAMVLGSHPRNVANALNEAMGIGKKRAMLIARTESLNAYRSATIERFKQNDDLLDGWVWTSAHQRRTCLSCLSLDSKTFPLTTPFRGAHPACRCAARPWLKGVDPKIGQSGEEWFAKQPGTVQDGILGAKGGSAYRAGDVRLADFRQPTTNTIWGNGYRRGSLADARAKAGQRAARVTKPTLDTLVPNITGKELFDAMPKASRLKMQANLESVIQDVEARTGYKLTRLDFVDDGLDGNVAHAQAVRQGDHRLGINVKSEWWDMTPAERSRSAGGSYFANFDDVSPLYHEFGHIHYYDAGHIRPLYLRDAELDQAVKVSRYAMTDDHEFMAEVFSSLMTNRKVQYGEPLTDDVIALYRAKGGVMPKEKL